MIILYNSILGAANALFSMLKISDGKSDKSIIDIDSTNQRNIDDKSEMYLPLEKIDELLNDVKSLISIGSIQESLDILLSIVQHSPEHQECNSLLGAVLLGMNQTSLAEGFLYSALKLSV